MRARRVLETLAQGHSVPTKDALQLRNWALTAEDAMLSLEEIACRVLNPKENVKADAARER